jgi:hypothetical protein
MQRKVIVSSSRGLQSALLVLSLLLYIPIEVLAQSEDPHSVVSSSPAFSAVDAAVKEIVQIREHETVPQSITLSKLDSSLFFYNATESGLVSLSVDFGPRRTHCWSPNLRREDDGSLRTISPLAPRDFAVLCLPDHGKYQVVISGADGSSRQQRVIVEVLAGGSL